MTPAWEACLVYGVHSMEYNRQQLERDRAYLEQTLQKIDEVEKELLEKLNDVEERRKAVLSIFRGYGTRGLGIIFQSNPFIQEKFQKKYNEKHGTVYYTQGGEAIIARSGQGETIITPNNGITDIKSAREFYRAFLHGIIVIQGTVEEQREILKRMLEATKDHPDRRLPIYNFYGKLVWPRPPKKEK